MSDRLFAPALALVVVVGAVALPAAGLAHGVMTAPESRAVGTPDEDYQFCFGTGECACGDFPDPGPIVATFTAGQVIQVAVEVTVTHETGPVFRFQLCPTADQSTACFQAGEFAAVDFDGQTGLHTYDVALPDGLVCDPCVLRWKWDYGFLSCADVRIVAEGTPLDRPTWTALKSRFR